MTATATEPVICERALFTDIEVRDIDEEKRTATFVIATEGGVDTWTGKQHLLMSGLDLTRYRNNPVVLDGHNRMTATSIIGRAPRIRVEKRRLVAPIEFAETDRAEEIWQLVKTGFARAVSAAFFRRAAKNLAEDETYGRGNNKITGPAEVVTEWELFENSIVPVGADADAVRDHFLRDAGLGLSPVLTRVVTNALAEHFLKEREMAKEKERTAEKTVTDAAPKDAEVHPADRETKVLEVPELDEEKRARIAEARRREILALAPETGYEDLVQHCIAKEMTVEEARQAILEEMTKRGAPVGTPEPPTPKGDGEKDAPKVADVSEQEFVRSITG